MHKFLRAVGFSKLTKEELDKVLKIIMDCPTIQRYAEDSEGNEFGELIKEFGDSFGISVRGTYDEEEEFHLDYYYPFFKGSTISTYEKTDIEKHAEKESYAGICDEVRVGVSLIFYLQNVGSYLLEKNPLYRMQRGGVALSALSIDGKILLPICKDEKKHEMVEKHRKDRNHLLAAARNGDEDAIENLTLEDIDTYSLLSKRILHEDILTIVENYFMPYGIESDQYAILGEIMDCRLLTNDYTGEQVYALDIVCNDMPFSVCINKNDLLGEPAVGRRFKGNIWLQGSIHYENY